MKKREIILSHNERLKSAEFIDAATKSMNIKWYMIKINMEVKNIEKLTPETVKKRWLQRFTLKRHCKGQKELRKKGGNSERTNGTYWNIVEADRKHYERPNQWRPKRSGWKVGMNNLNKMMWSQEMCANLREKNWYMSIYMDIWSNDWLHAHYNTTLQNS